MVFLLGGWFLQYSISKLNASVIKSLYVFTKMLNKINALPTFDVF